MAYIVAGDPRVRPLYRGTQVVWYLLNLLEVILLFRFILRLLGANSGAAFTQMVYSLSHPFVAPFQSVFGSSRIAGSVFEWTTLLAMLVYWLIAWGIVRLFVMSKPITTTEADVKLNQQDTTTY
jgi:hypothetical protein